MKKKNNLTRVITIAIMFVAGGGIGYLGAIVGGKAAASLAAPVMIALALLFIPAFFLVIAMHEGGHAWAGVRVNFDFRTYVVGPFLWDKQQDGWKFMWNKNINTSGGLVICIPTGTDNLAKRFSFYAAGGPLSSLVFAGVSLGVFLVGRHYLGQSLAAQIFIYFWLMTAFLSVMIFLVTAVPLHAGGFSSDGARVLRFMRGGDVARFEVLLLKILSSSMAGIRPRQFNKAELQEAHELATKLDAPMAVYVSYLYYQFALDSGEIEEAELHLNEYLARAEEVPEGMRGSVWLEAAFFYAVVRQELMKAEEYLSRYKPSALIPLAVEYATLAAIARMKNEDTEFHSWIEKAERALPDMMDRGVMQVVRERIEQMKAAG